MTDLLITDYFSVATAGIVVGFGLSTIVSFVAFGFHWLSELVRKI